MDGAGCVAETAARGRTKKPASTDAGFECPGACRWIYAWSHVRIGRARGFARRLLRLRLLLAKTVDMLRTLTASAASRNRFVRNLGAYTRAIVPSRPRMDRSPPWRLRHAWLLSPLLLAACATPGPRAPADTTPETLALETAARHGDAEAAFQLAAHYRARGDWRAERWLGRAARHRPVDRWVARAELELAGIEMTGRLDADAPTRKSRPAAAKRWLHRAAAHGSGAAMLALADAYRHDGAPRLAARWQLRHAMADGNVFTLASARKQLGGLPGWDRPDTAESQAAVQDLADAVAREAARGDTEALVDLGLLRHLGAGVAQDQAAAMDCFRRAADKGNVFGMYFAGLLIVREWMPELPREAAAPWFARAYAQGFYPAADPAWREIRFEFPDFSS
ncbi:hypothetical protein LDO26_09770 [Luteimonas sp. BDR2-5]|nr:hypothetical protein [Luteimonas sp. BDR2-5]